MNGVGWVIVGRCPDFQVTFPDTLSASAVEVLEKVLPPRPETEYDGDEEEPMLEVRQRGASQPVRSSDDSARRGQRG